MFLFNDKPSKYHRYEFWSLIGQGIHDIFSIPWMAYDNYQEDRQFDESMSESSRQFDAQMDFASRQHNDQMSIARQQMAAEQSNADRNFALQQEAQAWNQRMQERQFDYQRSLNDREFDYQKQLNATQMEREDTAMQRAVADYTAAGFSPLAALGSPASSAPLSSSSQSSADVSNVDAAQRDSSGINSAYGSWLSAAQQYAELGMAAYSGKASRDVQLANMRNSASLTRSQMRQQMVLSNRSLAMQVFDSASNARLKNAQAAELEARTEWMNEHGYRDDTSSRDLLYQVQAALTGGLRDYNESNGYRNQSVENLIAFLISNLSGNAKNVLDNVLPSSGSSGNPVSKALDDLKGRTVYSEEFSSYRKALNSLNSRKVSDSDLEFAWNDTILSHYLHKRFKSLSDFKFQYSNDPKGIYSDILSSDLGKSWLNYKF